jgi:hypothetical protein
MHHHDARFDMCRPCARHAQDSLGNIE